MIGTQTLNKRSEIIVSSACFSISLKIFDDCGHSVGLGTGKCSTAFEAEFHLGQRSISLPTFVDTSSWIEMSLDFNLDLANIPLFKLVSVKRRNRRLGPTVSRSALVRNGRMLPTQSNHSTGIPKAEKIRLSFALV